MKTRQLIIAISLTVTALLSGCENTVSPTAAQSPPASSPPVSYPAPSSSQSNVDYSGHLGVIDGIESVPGSGGGIAGSGIGAGTIIGGVVGGVLGHQVGGGTGKDIATAAGVVGGAVVGHEMDKRTQQQIASYNIRVRLNNGGNQTINVKSVNDMRIGDKVRIDNGQISRY